MRVPGELIDDRYLVRALLGRGGMGEVFRATDTATDRGVAVKVLRTVEPATLHRFESEAEILGRVEHPGTLRLCDSGTHDGVPYLVIELADGPSLACELRAGPLGADRTLTVGRQVADALGHAHRLGVVHRDVKPSNILFDDRGRARLADFGIARLAGTPSVTRTGELIGSAPYLAPEQVRGEAARSAADVYSLGLVLIECLTGRPCYSGGRVEAVVARLHRRPDVPGDLPAWLGDVLTAMTATQPERRPSAAAVALALSRRDAAPVLDVTAPVDLEDTTVAAPGVGDDAPTEPLRPTHPTAVLPPGSVPRVDGTAGDPSRRPLVALVVAVLCAMALSVVAWTVTRTDDAGTPTRDPVATSTSVAPTTVSTSAAPADRAPPENGRGNANGNANGNGQGRGNGHGNGRGAGNGRG